LPPLSDIRYALRTLRKSPGFTATALLALALGIGANTAIFSVVNAVLLKPLTYPDADRIVQLKVISPNGDNFSASATKFNSWRRLTQIFESVAAYEYNGASYNLTGGVFPEQVHTIRVSADYFHLLGAPLVQGRAFTADEDRPNAGHFAVLSHGLWQRAFAGNPNVIGRSISLSGTPYTVVGVVGPNFNTELDTPPDLFLPFQIDPLTTDQAHYFNVIARLRPGINEAYARTPLRQAADDFRARFPHILGPRDDFSFQSYADDIVSVARPSLLILTAAVGFVLLIACANVANLLLARATGRKRELAIRAALGAGRARIVRQLLTESLVLSIAGGALGFVFGFWGVRTLLAVMHPPDIPRIGENGSAISIDWSLALFSLAIALATGILFGLLPALQVSRTDLGRSLKAGGGRSGTGLRHNRTRALLVISETALALVLLIGAALLIRTFYALRAVNPGFDVHNILTLRMSLAGSHFQNTAAINRVVRQAIQNIEALPGVDRAAVSYTLPLEGAFGIPFNIVGNTPVSGQYDGRGWINASPGYFDAFRIPIVQGRAFNDRDDASAPRVAIVNQALARQFFPNANPLGRQILLGHGYGPEFEEPAREIIGVAGDVHDNGLNRNPQPVVYVPTAQVNDGITALANRAASMVWIVRTRVPPYSLRAPIENALARATSSLAVARVQSMEEVLSESTARSDFNMVLMTIFGSAALLLAVIGIYGLMSYSVAQRRQEIGIRMALGAESGAVRKMIVRQGMSLALTGIVIGLAAAFALTRLMANFLFGVEARDPLVFILVPAVLSLAALLAVSVPAYRAARTDPLDALRLE
jgi:putative ABC transport system permease protein